MSDTIIYKVGDGDTLREEQLLAENRPNHINDEWAWVAYTHYDTKRWLIGLRLLSDHKAFVAAFEPNDREPRLQAVLASGEEGEVELGGQLYHICHEREA